MQIRKQYERGNEAGLETKETNMTTLQAAKEYFQNVQNRDIENWKFTRLTRNRVLVDGTVYRVAGVREKNVKPVLMNLPGGRCLTTGSK